MAQENKNSLMSFEGKDVEIFEWNGKVLFNSRHVGGCLELENSSVRKAIGKMNEKQVIKLKNSDVKDMHIRKLNNAGESFLTESGVYKLIFKSHKEEAERFQDWVADEVLPAIRQNGVYISENITEEQEKKLDKYSTIKKIKNTFKTCGIENIEEEFKECMIYNKNKDGKEKNNIQRNIINALEERKQELTSNNKIALALVISESITNIKKKQMETNNKSRGQRLYYKDKQINKLGEQVETLEKKLNYYEPDEDEWIELNVHPFSHNYMIQAVSDWNTGEPRIVKNDSYHKWQYHFPKNQLPNFKDLGIDFNKRVCVWLRFVVKDNFDPTNCHKCILDTICNYYEVDDKFIELMECAKIGSCNEFKEGKTYIAFRNQ